jgi:hypothetical protein
MFVSELVPTDAYATKLLDGSGVRDPDDLARRFDAWMAHYEAEGIEAVGAGLILLRKRSADRHWVRIDDGPPYDDQAGAALLLGFRLRDFLLGSMARPAE